MNLTINFLLITVVALIPLVLGVLWFHPTLGGRIWRSNTTTAEQPLVHSFSVLQWLTFYLLSCLIAFALLGFVNHQLSIMQLFSTASDFGDTDSPSRAAFTQVLDLVGNRHLSFGHGAFHGFFGSIVFVVPILAHSSMRERRGFRPVLLYWVYWASVMTLVGGILGQWGSSIGN